MEIPMGFKQKGKNVNYQVLILKKKLYGLRQIPRAFWNYLTDKLEACGLDQ